MQVFAGEIVGLEPKVIVGQATGRPPRSDKRPTQYRAVVLAEFGYWAM